MADQKGVPVVGIAGVVGGVSVTIVALFAVFMKEQIVVAAWIVTALAIMGIALGYIASKKSG